MNKLFSKKLHLEYHHCLIINIIIATTLSYHHCHFHTGSHETSESHQTRDEFIYTSTVINLLTNQTPRMLQKSQKLQHRTTSKTRINIKNKV